MAASDGLGTTLDRNCASNSDRGSPWPGPGLTKLILDPERQGSSFGRMQKSSGARQPNSMIAPSKVDAKAEEHGRRTSI